MGDGAGDNIPPPGRARAIASFAAYSLRRWTVDLAADGIRAIAALSPRARREQ